MKLIDAYFLKLNKPTRPFYTLKTRYHGVLCGVFKVFVMAFAKMLCSNVLVSFADHHCFLTSSCWTRDSDGILTRALLEHLPLALCNIVAIIVYASLWTQFMT